MSDTSEAEILYTEHSGLTAMISDANCSVVEQKQENNWPVAGGLLGGRFIRTDTEKFVETAAFFQAFRYNRQRLE